MDIKKRVVKRYFHTIRLPEPQLQGISYLTTSKPNHTSHSVLLFAMPETLDNERFRLLLRTMPGKAIEFLYDHYYESLVKLSLKFINLRSVAEDIVQETFVQVWEQHKNLSNYNHLPIRFYLARIVQYKSISFYKKNLKMQENYAGFLQGKSPAQEQTIEMQMIDQEITQRIRSYIETFPTREKQCLTLKIDHLMTTKEIAADLGISVKAVERSITSAHKRLRKWARKEF